MTLPNFLIIGAAKTGTTSLYHYLKQHPQIYMSPLKEPHFFVFENGVSDFPKAKRKNYVRHHKDYEALFAEVKDEVAIGEASVIYLFSPKAAQRIRRLIPQAKLIAMLRHPVERAFSGFRANWRDGSARKADFRQVMTLDHWSVQRGLYYVQLKRYLDLFEPHQIRVYLYEDYQADPSALLQDLFGFLEVDPAFRPDLSQRHNLAPIPQHPFWRTLVVNKPLKAMAKSLLPASLRQWMITQLSQSKTISTLSLSPEQRRDLTEIFREDILQLQDLLGRDLSRWLE